MNSIHSDNIHLIHNAINNLSKDFTLITSDLIAIELDITRSNAHNLINAYREYFERSGEFGEFITNTDKELPEREVEENDIGSEFGGIFGDGGFEPKRPGK